LACALTRNSTRDRGHTCISSSRFFSVI